MHFLLTNDDGIEAPGLASLAAAIRQIPGTTLTVVAPDREYSQCGHRVTTHEPLLVQRREEGVFAVAGTPADCVRVALFGLGLKPDYVVSGVNAGGNMGQDVVISGTVAGAREAAYHGIPAVALSHYLVRGLALDWERTSRWAAEVLQDLIRENHEDGTYWNVNFPHLPPGGAPLPDRRRTRLSRPPLPVVYEPLQPGPSEWQLKYTGRYADRPAPEGSDVSVCFGGLVSMTRLSLHHEGA